MAPGRIALCFVLARRFSGMRLATAGRMCGVVFALGLGWAMSGGVAGPLTMFIGVVAAWAWIAATISRLT